MGPISPGVPQGTGGYGKIGERQSWPAENENSPGLAVLRKSPPTPVSGLNVPSVPACPQSEAKAPTPRAERLNSKHFEGVVPTVSISVTTPQPKISW